MARKKSVSKVRAGNKVGSRGRVAKAANATNGPATMTDDEIRAWQDKLDRQHTRHQKAVDDAKTENGAYRDMLKSAKKLGFDKDAYIQARELDKEDHGYVQIRYANVGRYLRVRGSNLATQLELFQGIEPPVVDDETPSVKGLKAGRSGLVNQDANPYPPGGEDNSAWDNNWRAGQMDLAEKTLQN